MKNIKKLVMLTLLMSSILFNGTYASFVQNSQNSSSNGAKKSEINLTGDKKEIENEYENEYENENRNEAKKTLMEKNQVKVEEQQKIQNQEKEEKQVKLQELKQKNEEKKLKLNQRLRIKLENALSNKFQAIEKMQEQNQIQIYTKIRENIQKLENKNTYTGTSTILLDILKNIVEEKINNIGNLDLEQDNVGTGTTN